VALRAQAEGREFSAYPVDLADFDSCKEYAARIAQEVGPIDILVNNAGITRDTLDAKMLPQIPLRRSSSTSKYARPFATLRSRRSKWVT
jgi:NAD(P)-dependent dehydrogenase (short-subunit alcohol dehydrogenase family)